MTLSYFLAVLGYGVQGLPWGFRCLEFWSSGLRVCGTLSPKSEALSPKPVVFRALGLRAPKLHGMIGPSVVDRKNVSSFSSMGYAHSSRV